MKDKKIGIITFNRAHNYGATLQCLALLKVISDIRKDDVVRIIDYRNKYIENPYKLFYIDKSSIYFLIKSFFSTIIFFPKKIVKFYKYNNYIKNHLNLTPSCKNVDDVKNMTKNYKCLITGSDQVWNISLTGGIDNVYFLNFESTAKKIAYSVSLGSNKMKEKEKYKKLLNNFDIISVREKDGCTIISNILNRNIANTIDPTLLLEKKDWLKYINKNKINLNYIFVYTPNNIKEFPKIVNYISNKMQKQILNLKKSNFGYKNVLKNVYTSTPDEFLNYIFYSDLVISTSFHATVFAIIFEKKFWVIAPKDNNSRINSLLLQLGLKNRSINSLEEMKKQDLNKNIDYKNVNKKINDLRIFSKNWLKESLDEVFYEN